MRSPKRSQYQYAKSRYRVLNWGVYETGLQMRGALTVWLSDAALEAWRAPATGRPGGQPTYSDLAIEAALAIRMIFRLTSRRRADCARVPELLDQIEDRVATFMADGAYHTGAVYETRLRGRKETASG